MSNACTEGDAVSPLLSYLFCPTVFRFHRKSSSRAVATLLVRATLRIAKRACNFDVFRSILDAPCQPTSASLTAVAMRPGCCTRTANLWCFCTSSAYNRSPLEIEAPRAVYHRRQYVRIMVKHWFSDLDKERWTWA